MIFAPFTLSREIRTVFDKNEYEAATLATINEKLKLDIRSMEGLNGEVKQLAQNIDRIFENGS